MGAFSDNPAKHRFEYLVGEFMAVADYRREGSTLFIDYVEAPPELRGTGAAGKLMEEIMAFAAREKLQVTPICGYAANWIARHPK
ncbi:MAG: GNAT family N-acetyltransferase [Alphaproteobacteria bacterium]